MDSRDTADIQATTTPGGVLSVLQFLLVLVLPLVSFPLGEVFAPEWQTGSFTDRVALHLDPAVTRIFAPFIFVAWIAILVATVAERTVARFRIARYALYSGVVVSTQYFLITLIAFNGLILIPVAALFGATAVCVLLYRRHGRAFVIWSLRIGGGLWLLIAIGGAATGNGASSVLFLPSWPLLATLFSGPAICLAIAMHRSRNVWRLAATERAATPTDRLIGSAAGAAWGVGYLVAWRSATTKAVELYEALPESPPDCYVATAAARGHPGVVRSWTTQTTNGSTFAVTRQLQTLKAAELSVRALSPRLHRAIRRVYDRLGPCLAERLTSPLRADIAYVTLKPWEWISRVTMRRLLSGSATAHVYGTPEPAKPPCRRAEEWL